MYKKTAIQWFLDNIPIRFKNAFENDCKDEILKALEIEKEHIDDSYDQGYMDGKQDPHQQKIRLNKKKL